MSENLNPQLQLNLDSERIEEFKIDVFFLGFLQLLRKVRPVKQKEGSKTFHKTGTDRVPGCMTPFKP